MAAIEKGQGGMTMTPSQKIELIQETLLAENNILSISELCSSAGVSRSGYYRWLNAAPIRQKRELKDRADFELILQAYRFRGYDKGIRGDPCAPSASVSACTNER